MLGVLLVAGGALAGQADPGLRVEAEAPLERRGAGSFARPFAARWASGRVCLVGFHEPGSVTYAFEVPRPGVWSLWLRYAAARDVGLPVTLTGTPVGGPPGAAAERDVLLPATGALQGKDAWGQAELFRGPLAAGPLRATLAGAPLRPDVLELRPAEAGPPVEERRAVPELSPGARAALARPLTPLRPAWLAALPPHPAPAWYEATRLSVHTRLSPRWREREVFRTVEASVAALGVHALVRHVRTRGEGAWWPSAVGAVEPWADEEPVRAMVARAHAAGLRLVGYYRHVEDQAVAEEHPDWLCRDDLGRVRTGRGGVPEACLASPYADELLTRLDELAERGVDGIYFDEHHVPREGCFCASCRELWARLTDLPFPETVDDEDPLYRKLGELADWKIESFFRRVRERLSPEHPELALVIGNNLAPDLFDRHTSTRLGRLADGVKTEYGKGDSPASESFFRRHPELWAPPRASRLASGWALCRDMADGRPPHVWIHGIESAAAARAAAGAVCAWGGVANLDVVEGRLPGAEIVRPAVELAGGLEAALAGTRPVRWAAVHFPEAARDRTADDLAAWYAVLAPVLGMWDELLARGVPSGLVTDAQLAGGELAGVHLLLLPAPEALDDDQRAAVEAFRAADGRVLAQRPGWDWARTAGRAAAGRAFGAALAPELADLPVRATGLAPGVQLVLHRAADGRRAVVCLVNDPAWVWTERRELPGGSPAELPPGIDVPPPAREGVGLVLPGSTDALEVPAFEALWWKEIELDEVPSSTAREG